MSKVMHEVLAERRARRVCVWCQRPVVGNTARCLACRIKCAHAKQTSATRRGTYEPKRELGAEEMPKNPYRGKRPCSQRISEQCEKVFLSPDRRAIHCCEPCREMQLRITDEV